MNDLDIKALKQGGVMKQKQKDLFSLRLRLAGGNISTEKLATVMEVANAYGDGYIHLTTRQGIEISFVHFKNIEKARKKLAEAGVEFGACGPRIRTVVGCQGSAMCSHGLIDGRAWTEKIDRDFYGLDVPGKFKIAITGCTYSCAKPQENDLGFSGAAKPVFDPKECISCGLCVKACQEEALTLVDGKPKIDWERCNYCGKCAAVCPVSACSTGEVGVTVWAGGKVGRKPRLADRVVDFLPEGKIPVIIERTLNFYRKHGRAGERFGTLLDRCGLNLYKKEVFYDC